MNKIEKILEKRYGVIKNIPSEIGLYNTYPIFVEKEDLINNNIHTCEREINNIKFLIRQYSPSYRQKSSDGKYFYIVYYKLI